MGVDLGGLVHFHFLDDVSLAMCYRSELTYHFESVQFLLDLLCQERGEFIARGNLTTTIVFAGRPGVVESELWAERNVPLPTARADGSAVSIGGAESTGRQGKVLAIDGHGVGATVASGGVVGGSTAGTGARGAMHVWAVAGGIGRTDGGRIAASF